MHDAYTPGSRFLFFLLLASLGLQPGCALKDKLGFSESAPEINQQDDTLWRFRDQYIRLAPAEEGARPNDHPVRLSAPTLQALLATLHIERDGEELPVFDEKSRKVIAAALASGLARAGADQDIVIAKAGYYSELFGVVDSKRITTARVFRRDGKLNLIFGEILRPFKEGEDRRLNPIRMGSRGDVSQLRGSLVTHPGLTLARDRQDWLAANQTVIAKAKTRAKATADPAARNAQARQRQAQVEADQKALQQKVERLESQLNDVQQGDANGSQAAGAATGPAAGVAGASSAPAARQASERPPASKAGRSAPPRAAPAPGPSAASPPANATEPVSTQVTPRAASQATSQATARSERILQTRLMILKRLLHKGLITQDVYQQRVNAVLDEDL